jgi:translocation and assembly module TamB
MTAGIAGFVTIYFLFYQKGLSFILTFKLFHQHELIYETTSMQSTNKKETNKRTLLSKIGRGFAWFFLSLIALLIIVLLLIQTQPVQNFAKNKIVSFLENKLQTRVEIERLDIDFPKMLVLKGVYIEDQEKDTLLAGGLLKVDIAMFKLLSNEVEINQIVLENITAKIKRQLPDTTFNFQFIIDAFISEETKPKSTDTAAMKISIDKIIVDKTRFVYKDVVTGNDVDVYVNHFDTRINIFDPDRMRFDVPGITLNGVRGVIKQSKPLEITAVNTNPDTLQINEAPAFLRLTNDITTLENIHIDYSNAVSGIKTKINFKNLVVRPRDIDMENSVIALDEIELNNLSGYLAMNKVAETDVVKLTDENRQTVDAAAMPWVFTVKKIRLNNNNFVYDDNSQPKLARGMDYAHMGISDLTLHADNFLFNNDTIATEIIKGTMKEKSGFQLNTLQANFEYTPQGASFTNLLIKTPGSEIKRSLVVKYPSLQAVQKDMNTMELFANLDHSRILVKDILLFAPQLASQPAFSNPNATLLIDSKVSGTMARLQIDHFVFKGFKNTAVDVSGTIFNATDPDKFNADLNIRKLTTTRSDIVSLVPPNTIPSNITIPQNISANGTIRGGMQQMLADLQVNTSLGNAAVKGTIANATNTSTATYNVNISATSLQLGTILQQPENFGKISASFSANGKGFDLDKAKATLSGTIQSAEIKGYTYKNLKLDADVANQKMKANASLHDPNLDFTLQARANLGGSYPGFNIVANIDSIKTQPLQLTPDVLIYRGKIKANFPEFNLDALQGNIQVTNSLLVMNKQRLKLDSIAVVASHENNNQAFTVNSDFLSAKLSGKYKLEQLGDIFFDVIQPYYAISDSSVKTAIPDPYDVTITANIYDHPALYAFQPDLKKLENISLNASLSSYNGLHANVSAPYINYAGTIIDNLSLQAETKDQKLFLNTNIEKVASGPSIEILGTQLKASIADNKVDFALLIKDQASRNKYKLKGLLAQQPNKELAFSLHADSLLLNYETWTVNPGNVLRFGPNVLNAKNFNLSRNNQQLLINSETQNANSPLSITFSNFKLATLTALVQTDTLLVNGNINGDILLRDILDQPKFTTDLSVNNLAINNDTLGDLNAKVNNNQADVFNTNITLTGQGNDVKITGDYIAKPGNNSTVDFTLAVNKLQLNTLEGASFGNLKNARGYLSGNVDIEGKVEKPDIDGKLNFNETSFIVPMLNSLWKVDNESLLVIDNTGFRFNTFTIRDSANNKAVLDGMAYTTNYTNYKFDLSFKARNFQGLNSTKQDNSLYYGDLFFDADLNITGTEELPVVDGSVKVNEGTKLTVVLPQTDPGLVSREGVIVFVDKDAPIEDSLFLTGYDSLNLSSLVGFDVTVNIEVDPKAEFNMVIDEANGDFIKLRGQAALNGGIDKSGKITLVGSYELVEGAYELSFNLIKRRFLIQKGSTIVWTGEPTEARLDVTAIYKTEIAAADLVRDVITTASSDLRYRQKLPFEVHLMMAGKLLEPVLTFDIKLGEENNVRIASEITDAVTTQLERLRQEPSELNKQVFAVLLLNRFISQDPFASSGGGFNAGSLARQSVSKILTQQLNNLAGNLIAGVDVNFDINSQEDYTSGQLENRTDFGVQLSKRLLNDRLKVTVGSNYQLEGSQAGNQRASNIAGDVALEYYLSKDGRYLLRAYRKNLYEGVIEGYVIETGIGFKISIDYDKFKEIFKRKKPSDTNKKATEKDMNEAPDTTQPANSSGAPLKDNEPVNKSNAAMPADKIRSEDE